jgi:selenocysteine lyase/cysteine desulfurase
MNHSVEPKLTFGDTSHYFNSAALGHPPTLYYEPKDSFDWDRAVKIVQQRFGKLLGQSTHTISVFHNTTAAVQRILLRLTQLLGRSDPTLLLTDLEYPGIVSAVDETWTGRVIMAQLADLVWRKEFSKVVARIQESILISRPSVIYISHVARATGFHLAESIVDFVREYFPRTVIIIDGAQSCGNIYVDPDFISKIDFYVASGHKWLCGEQTLGLVYSHEHWGTKDPAQSYSMTRGSTGTGSRAVIQSLQQTLTDFNGELTGETARDRMIAIEEHNAELSKYFCSEVVRKHLGRPVGTDDSSSWRWNGISTVVFDSLEIIQRLKTAKWRFTSLVDESWRDNFGADAPASRYFLNSDSDRIIRTANFKESYVPLIEGYPARFCFHYYHNHTHVDDLIDAIQIATNFKARRHEIASISITPSEVI